MCVCVFSMHKSADNCTFCKYVVFSCELRFLWRTNKYLFSNDNYYNNSFCFNFHLNFNLLFLCVWLLSSLLVGMSAVSI